jgi:uncharacterized protein YbaP (TraB family)
MIQRARLFIFLCLLAVFFCSAAKAANDRGFLWQISSEDATVYVLGSIHFADQSFYPLRAEIEEAFERSEFLVVELDITAVTADKYKSLLASKGSYKNGRSIEDELSVETMSALHARLKSLGIEYDSVKQLKPGMMVLTLTSVQLMQLGLDPALGIDIHFINASRTTDKQTGSQVDSKTVIELESIDQQFNLFLDISDGDLLLKETLYSMDEAETMMSDIVRYWKSGDEAAMNRLLFEDTLRDYPAFDIVYESLFYERNRQMTEKIAMMLKQPRTKGASYFVVVGSGHLIGDRGIVNLLKQKGYSAKRL